MEKESWHDSPHESVSELPAEEGGTRNEALPQVELEEVEEQKYQRVRAAIQDFHILSLADRPITADANSVTEYFRLDKEIIKNLDAFSGRLNHEDTQLEAASLLIELSEASLRLKENNPLMRNAKLGILDGALDYLYDFIFERKLKIKSGGVTVEQARVVVKSLSVLIHGSSDKVIDATYDCVQHERQLFIDMSASDEGGEIFASLHSFDAYIHSQEFELTVASAVQERCDADAESPHLWPSGTSSGKHIRYCESILRDIIERYDLPADEMLEVWKFSRRDKKKAPHPEIKNNIRSIIQLEKVAEGISQTLYKNFGIRNFERYPKELLIRQYREIDNTEAPYGIMLSATHDHNGAFSNWDVQDTWIDMVHQMNGEYEFRIVEADNVREVARRLVALDKKYGESQKISFAFICGHGTKDSITFGGKGTGHLLHTEDLKGTGVQRTGGFFVPHPVIVLASCGTGVSGGIGQGLSETLEAKVIAPSTSTGMPRIDVRFDGDDIDFDITYFATSSASGKVRTQVFQGGEEVE